MTAAALRRELERLFHEGGLPEPEADAKWLVLGVLGWSATDWLLRREEALSAETVIRLRTLAARRLTREPLQWLLGEWEFMGLPFRTDRRGLVPRNDTELVVRAALEAFPRGTSVLDWGCGSGCIGLSLAKLGDFRVTLADISESALALAEENRQALGVSARLCRWDMAAPAGEVFDCVISNPPYIPRGELSSLSPEVRKEPLSALDGGKDGLDFFRLLAARTGDTLAPGGWLALEMGRGQFDRVAELFRFPLRPIPSLEGWPIGAIGRKPME